MKIGLWISVGVALAAGFAVGVLAGPRLFPASPSADLFDLSALPEELREQHRDPDYLKKEIAIFDAGQQAMAAYEARQAARVPLKLPEGLDWIPLGMMFEPAGGAHWPQNVDGDLGAALEAAKDGWVVLNYWASWCAPCVHELPDMGEAAPLFAEKGVTLIAVNTDVTRKDTSDSARALFAEKGVANLEPFFAEGAMVDVLLEASGQNAKQVGLPTTLIFAPGGEPYAMFQGGDMTKSGVWVAPDTLAFLDAITAGS